MFNRSPSKLYCRQDERTRAENIRRNDEIMHEIEDLVRQGKITERAIRCSACNRVIMTAFSDCDGHMTLQCECGVISLVNLGTCCTKKVDNTEDIDF